MLNNEMSGLRQRKNAGEKSPAFFDIEWTFENSPHPHPLSFREKGVSSATG